MNCPHCKIYIDCVPSSMDEHERVTDHCDACKGMWHYQKNKIFLGRNDTLLEPPRPKKIRTRGIHAENNAESNAESNNNYWFWKIYKRNKQNMMPFSLV